MTLTAPQGRVLDAVRGLTHELGYAPSQAEIADRVGLHRSTVRFHLAALAANGHIRTCRGGRRTIALTEEITPC